MPRNDGAGRPLSSSLPVSRTTGDAPPLISLVAHTRRLVDLLPPLHQHALNVTGGSRSLLFEHNPRNGAMQATSGFGVDELPTEPWVPAPDEAAFLSGAFARAEAIAVTDLERRMPDLASRLKAPAALLLPLGPAEEPVGVVAVGLSVAAPTFHVEE